MRVLPLPRASGLLARALGRASRRPRRVPREERRARSRQAARDVAGRVSRASGGDGSAASLPPSSAARGAAAARAEPGAAVVSRIERPRLGPSAQRWTGEAALVASASAVPTSALLVTGAALQVAPNIVSIAHGDRHPPAPNLRRGRHAMHRVRRAHDGARGRDGPRVHRPPARRAPSRARPTRRRLTSPPSNARHVAPCPPHAPTADPAPPSCEPSPLRWPTLRGEGEHDGLLSGGPEHGDEGLRRPKSTRVLSSVP